MKSIPVQRNLEQFASLYVSHLACAVSSVDGSDAKKTACYDIDVEVDDSLKQQMNNFLLSTQSQQEIATLDNKVSWQAELEKEV